jgi:serine phosphatase RsbU (regulator of sigma subunit)
MAGRFRTGRFHGASAAILAACLLLVGTLAGVANANKTANEVRLLNLQVRQAVVSLGAAITPTVQTPLLSAYELGTTEPSQLGFQTFASSYVRQGRFTTMALIRIDGTNTRVVDSVGAPPSLLSNRELETQLARGIRPSDTFTVTRFTERGAPRFAFYELPRGGDPRFIIYAESKLPARTRTSVAPGSPYSDLNFAAYLGAARPENLFLSTTGQALSGNTARGTIPFGSTEITVVASPMAPLEGGLAGSLPWIILLAGIVLSVLAALVTERLLRRRDVAEDLAAENRRLYGEQRTIASTLQGALLPRSLPKVAGVEVVARYLPGVDGLDVGGDWYDLVSTREGAEFVFVVGDVSGRGLAAATTMASLRFALRGFILQGDPPDVALGRLTPLLNVEEDGLIATVLCCSVDVRERAVTASSAGHLPPVLFDGAGSTVVELKVGPPVGAGDDSSDPPVNSFVVPPGAGLLAFTDGLIERRGESLEVGYERLAEAAADCEGSLEQSVDRIVERLCPRGPEDDIAILGIRWEVSGANR